MEMRYMLFEDRTGVVLSRQPDVVTDTLSVLFEGAPNGATAIFENDGGQAYYRELVNGTCEIPISDMIGLTAVSVAVLDGGGNRFNCEGIVAKILKSGEILVAPNDMNLPNLVVALKMENQEFREAFRRLADVPEKLERLFDRVKDLERKTQVIL